MIRSLSTSFYHSSLVLNSFSSSTISSILSYSTIAVTKHAGLRSITLNRPDKLNAFNNDMYNEVRDSSSLLILVVMVMWTSTPTTIPGSRAVGGGGKG